ncbi:MAG TPA: iron-sulfur cluster assembly protein [Anaerolineaceae bacterium]|nr:iron-sulfur cluster assembly protein [Anaerolineaceae bacterium]
MSEENKSENIAHWQSEKNEPELTELLREGLREVKDPEIGLDIIALGLVREVVINPEDAQIKMILTTIYCPYGPHMLEKTREKAEEILQRPVNLELGMEMWDYSMMEDGGAAETWGWY